MKWKISHNHINIILVIIVTLGIMVGIFLNISGLHNSNKKIDLAKIANSILLSCAHENSRQTCYDKQIPKVLDQGVSFSQSFDVIKLIQNQDSGYWFCHTVAHNLSETEYSKNKKDWSEIIAECPVGMCSNGCIHGVIQKRFGYDTPNNLQLDFIVPIYKTICNKRANWDPTEQQRATCYHELGHLSFFTTNGNLEKAATICDRLTALDSNKDYLQTCYEGITMSVFQPLEPDDFSVVYPLIPDKSKIVSCEQYNGEAKGICWRGAWPGNIKNFCSQFKKDLANACFREGWVTIGPEVETAKGIIDYCSYSKEPSELKKCYNKLYYGLVSRFQFDEVKMENLCKNLPKTLSPQCFANTASRLIETDQSLVDRSVAVCKAAELVTDAAPCYEELVYYAGFIFKNGSEEFTSFCQDLPKKWSDQCLK